MADWGARTIAACVVALVLIGCAGWATAPDADALAFFASRGEAFTPREAPSGGADWRDEVVRFQPGSSVESAVYGVVRCVDPSKACTFGGVPEAGRTRPVWIVGFDQTPADSVCPRWVVVELVTVEDDLGSHVEQPWCAS